MNKRLLVIGGSDSSGGAGIQADIKTACYFGVYASTAITAITAQNSLGVQDIKVVDEQLLKAQITSVLSDIGTDAIKIGMLALATQRTAIEQILCNYPSNLLVIDPVTQSSSGQALWQGTQEQAIPSLWHHATMLTPNIPEAEFLTKMPIHTVADQVHAAKKIRNLSGAKYVLVKGGHHNTDQVIDILSGPDGEEYFVQQRIDSIHTHGTGCTLASAIACGLALGQPVKNAITEARHYISLAIDQAPGFGQGAGPLNHCPPRL
ncbi:MAG TPA: bifunctional hydroxymethylpyrimidine kinase/phosphomethylpyrimidine kinase, partial [Gammaproteobacteria bacterium]|nr:bifunctional hydroxymethylpyrimidine kinase/phosphomethylpyrimidine kinase [Gammaproteobacteria bacterium]